MKCNLNDEFPGFVSSLINWLYKFTLSGLFRNKSLYNRVLFFNFPFMNRHFNFASLKFYSSFNVFQKG
jgi:hypothetical protein